MTDDFAFCDLLADYIEDSGFSAGVISRLSNVPRKTIQHWVNGHVKRPNTPNDLLAVAKALRLTAYQTDALLVAAGHPMLVDLARLSGDPQTRSLLTFWHDALASSAPPPPFQAIVDLPTLVGRDREIRTLIQVLRGGDYLGICCLSGMGGVGKTVLAAHLAYRLRPHFPDGVLWARVDVTSPLAILSAFAQAFDYDVSCTRDLHARSQMVRSILANKRVLVVFDNVRQRAEIEPLLPPSGSCRVVITTRHHDLLMGMAGYRMVIEPFSADGGGAQALFTQLLGAERATGEQGVLREIAELVGYLPLALAIVASRLASEPKWTTADFAARLRAAQGRLGKLEYDNRSVRATLTLSYATLSAVQQRCLMALCVCAGADVEVAALAAITGLPAETTLDVVRALHGLSLVQDGHADRFRTHLLVKAYVLEQVIAPALWRAMATYFLTYLMQYQYRYKAIDGEFDNILGAFAAALRYGLEALYVRGVIMFSPYLRDRGHYDRVTEYIQQAALLCEIGDRVDDRLRLYVEQGQLAEQERDKSPAERIWRMGLALARKRGNAAWVAAMLIPLGEAVGSLGKVVERETHWQEALTKIATVDDRGRASELLRQLGSRMVAIGDFNRAKDHWREALVLAREVGDSTQVCRLLVHLSALLYEQGDWVEAVSYAEEGLDLARRNQFDWFGAPLLGTLGIIAAHQLDFVSAKKHTHEGLTLARASGYRFILSELLLTQSVLSRLCGDYSQVEHSLSEAQDLVKRLRFPCLICEITYEGGELDLIHQRWERATEAFEEAWKIAQEQQLHLYLAPIAYGLARLAKARANYDEAYRWGKESLQRHEALGHHKTTEVAEWLALLGTVEKDNRLYIIE